MNIKLGTGNRICMPSKIVDQLSLKPGSILNIYVEGSKIVIEDVTSKQGVTTVSITKSKSENSTEVKNTNDSNKKSTKSNYKIVSNLEESKNYYRKLYSECGLVVRTKGPLVKRFCEHCMGQLVRESGRNDLKCSYMKSIEETSPLEEVNQETVEQELVQELESIKELETKKEESKVIRAEDTRPKNRVEKKPKTIAEWITDLKTNKEKRTNINEIKDETDTSVIDKPIKPKSKKEAVKLKKEVIEPKNKTLSVVNYGNVRKKCDSCGEFHNIGFKVDNDFYCKACAINDFKEYMRMRGDLVC